MKSLLTLILSSFYLLNLQAQSDFTDNPELWAKGRYNPSYNSGLSNTKPQIINYQIERWVKKDWILEKGIETTYRNCNELNTQLFKNFYDNTFNGKLDSFSYSSGNLIEVFSFIIGNPLVVNYLSDRVKYFYSNNKLDSIITVEPSSGLAIDSSSGRDRRFRYFKYDIPNRITIETTGYYFQKVKMFSKRYTSQLDTNGNLIKYKEEYFQKNEWYTETDQLISWSSNKVLSIKLIFKPGLDYGSNFVLDTSRYRVVYYDSTNKIDSIFIDSHDSISNKWYRNGLSVNEKPNSKGFPTKITEYFTNNDFTPVEDYELSWDKGEDFLFSYYPGDTLVRQFVRPQNKRETFQYCGIPTLTATNELQTLDFKIYPNPTNQVLNIEIPENMAFNDIPNTFGTEGPSVEIFNAMGIMVSKTKELNVDVSTLPTGIYFVQTKTKDRVGVKRFIVNR
jgi:hypothetical protein